MQKLNFLATEFLQTQIQLQKHHRLLYQVKDLLAPFWTKSNDQVRMGQTDSSSARLPRHPGCSLCGSHLCTWKGGQKPVIIITSNRPSRTRTGAASSNLKSASKNLKMLLRSDKQLSVTDARLEFRGLVVKILSDNFGFLNQGREGRLRNAGVRATG